MAISEVAPLQSFLSFFGKEKVGRRNGWKAPLEDLTSIVCLTQVPFRSVMGNWITLSSVLCVSAAEQTTRFFRSIILPHVDRLYPLLLRCSAIRTLGFALFFSFLPSISWVVGTDGPFRTPVDLMFLFSFQGSLSVPVMFHIPMVEWPVGKVIPLFLGHVSSAVRQPFLSRRCDRHNPGGEGGGRGCLWYDGTNPHRRHKPIDETNQVDARTLAPRRMPQEMRSDACAARWRRATHGRSRAEENARQRWKRRIATATGTCVHQKRRDPTPWLLATCQKTSVPCAAHRWSAAASAAHRWIG